jgi:hypothetical protein
MRADRDSGLGKLLSDRFAAAPGSDERKAADEKVEKIDDLKKNRTPQVRHAQRIRALYVDPVSTDRWNRPSIEISQSTAQDFISDATNDYAGEHERYTNLEITKDLDPDLFKALEQWPDRPELPLPERPTTLPE